jgi:type IV pilus assembly protein PilA
MKKKRNNKGFSLVELIVVMAIMAILAVTLAPSLTKYVEKSRVAADKEVINSIYTAAQYAILDEKILNDATSIMNASSLSLNSDTTVITAASEIYSVTGKTWATNSTYTNAGNSFVKEIFNVVGNFKLKSNSAGGATDIIIRYNAGVLSVLLKYDRAVTDVNADYTVSSSDVR